MSDTETRPTRVGLAEIAGLNRTEVLAELRRYLSGDAYHGAGTLPTANLRATLAWHIAFDGSPAAEKLDGRSQL